MQGNVDKVSHASLNGIYVKAQALDRGQNEKPAPWAFPAGFVNDAETHASVVEADVETHASSHASTHASTGR